MAMYFNGHLVTSEEEKEFRKNYDYGNTKIGEIQEKLNKKYPLED